MQTVSLCDHLWLRVAPGELFTCSDPGLGTGPDNLVRRALAVFRAAVGPTPPLRVHLAKRIPIGAGLGGGSADAAAALRALNRLCGMPCTWDDLRRLGLRLGADVPFLVAGGTAVARGRGELLQPLVWRGAYTYVLASPDVQVDTAWAYAALDAFRARSPSVTRAPADGPVPDRPARAAQAEPGGWATTDGLTGRTGGAKFAASVPSGGCADHEHIVAACLHNDFEPVVRRAYPIVADLLARLLGGGALASTMTGSGSTVVGIFDDRKAAALTRDAVRAAGHRSFLCWAVRPPGDAVHPASTRRAGWSRLC